MESEAALLVERAMAEAVTEQRQHRREAVARRMRLVLAQERLAERAVSLFKSTLWGAALGLPVGLLLGAVSRR